MNGCNREPRWPSIARAAWEGEGGLVHRWRPATARAVGHTSGGAVVRAIRWLQARCLLDDSMTPTGTVPRARRGPALRARGSPRAAAAMEIRCSDREADAKGPYLAALDSRRGPTTVMLRDLCPVAIQLQNGSRRSRRPRQAPSLTLRRRWRWTMLIRPTTVGSAAHPTLSRLAECSPDPAPAGPEERIRRSRRSVPCRGAEQLQTLTWRCTESVRLAKVVTGRCRPCSWVRMCSFITVAYALLGMSVGELLLSRSFLPPAKDAVARRAMDRSACMLVTLMCMYE